jgi:hypothetical protein
MAPHASLPHRWYTPADCAAMLLAMRHGKSYRGPCPVHGGESTDCLSITEGTDKYGHPCTVIKCFAHDCHILDICESMDIELKNLFAITLDYARETQRAPRAHSPRIDRLKSMEEPSPDEIAQIMLEEMIVSDPAFIQECQPARQKMWELASASPKAKEALTKALYHAHLSPAPFWKTLAAEMEG